MLDGSSDMKPQLRSTLLVVAAVAVAFAGGAAWQFTQARHARNAHSATLRDLTLVQRERVLVGLEASVALATVAAQLGDFERARQLASDFFAGLQDNAASAPEDARSGFDEILAQRDRIITVLSRGQPEAGIEMVVLLISFQRALGKEPTISVPAPADQTTDSS